MLTTKYGEVLTINCRNGKTVEHLLDVHNLCFLNNRQPTHICVAIGNFLAIDLTLVSSRIAADSDWLAFSDFHGSDHAPIYFTYKRN